MHSYLRAIGFSDLKSGRELETLLQDVIQNCHERTAVREGSSQAFVEYAKSFAPDMGIRVCGTMDQDGFHREFYFPYFRGTGISTREDLMVEKRGDSDSFAGVCEDVRIGVSLIFFLQNVAEYKKKCILNQLPNERTSTTFSGLSLEGKILFPICKSQEQIVSSQEASTKRSHLIAEARKGDEEAIESLTLEDIDMYTMAAKRIQSEDLFSIVESFFMPHGLECDQYHIMGVIKEVTKVENKYTKEKIYQLNIESNDMTFDVCINQKDLVGEPEEGRRFKGVIWLQGNINFSKDD